MAGGFIYNKTIIANTNGAVVGGDKCLLIEPNHAYQVPLTFGNDWEDIEVGMYVSFVATGVGNEDVAAASSNYETFYAGGTTPDTFTYYGLVKEQPTKVLPLTSDSSGYIGIKSDAVYFANATSNSTARSQNKFSNSDHGNYPSQGRNTFLTSTGSSVLESKQFNPLNGNYTAVGLSKSELLASRADDQSAPDHDNASYFAFWGTRYQVKNKGYPNQEIRVTSSFTKNTQSTYDNAGGLDPSTGSLINIMNGIGRFTFPTSANYAMHPNASDGFKWNDGSSNLPLPDSLFFYNGFSMLRPRIHAWAVKKIS